MASVTVDFVARELPHGGWGMVLVEQGPWEQQQIESNLRRLQERLYNCIDAAIDGNFAELYPDSAGKPVLIRLDAYNIPEAEVREFFERFSGAVLQIPDYVTALKTSSIVPSIEFELNVERIQG